MTKKNTIIGLLTLCILIILIGYSNRSNTHSQDVLLVGAITPLSGPAGVIGEEVKRSLDLKKFKNIEIVHEDDQCDAKKAISAYNNLKLKGVKVFYVACSGSVMSLAPLAKTNGDLVLTAYAGSSEIRKTGTEVIRFVPDALSVVEEMSVYLKEDSQKRYAIMYENLDYPKSATDSIKEKLGDQIVLNEGYSAEYQSFKTQLLKIKEKNIDGIIMIPVSDKATRIILKEMKQLGIVGKDVKIIGEVNLCDYPFSPAEFGFHGVCWKAGVKNPGFDTFVSRFDLTYSIKPQYPFYSALTYDSLTILSRIVENTGGTDIQKIKAEIMKGQKGEIAEYVFDQNGEVLYPGKYLEKIEF